MIEGIPKISIIVITYKQEEIVGRTLDSLINQRDYLYEICVSDDCSPDGTWEVLLDYKNRYPDLIKLHRQEHNVGIFENTEYQWTMPTGDIVNEIAGDDVTPDGWYKAVIDYIRENNIDWKNELFCIYGDFMAIYPNGDSMVFSNKAISKRPNEAFRLVLRGIVTGRGCCYSIKVHRKFVNVSQGRSHIAETAQDSQRPFFTEKNYYIPRLSNVYYTGIGVSTRINSESFEERLKIWPYAEAFFKSRGFVFTRCDKNYGKYNIAMKRFRYNRNIVSFIDLIKTYILSRDFSLPHGNGFKHFLFAIVRRLPHNRPIRFK